MCQGNDLVSWHMIGLGTTPEIHSIRFQGHTLQVNRLQIRGGHSRAVRDVCQIRCLQGAQEMLQVCSVGCLAELLLAFLSRTA